MDQHQCVKQLKEMPIFTDGYWIDGKDYGCRVLHSVLAKENPRHCPHLSFELQADSRERK